MSRESVILAGRRFSEEAFTATCTVKRDTGTTTTDPVTYEDVPVYAVVYTNLQCKIKDASTRPQQAQVPGQTVVKTSPEWHVPMSTTGVLTNDIVTIEAVDPVTGDLDLVGRTFRVTGPFVQSYATARRFPVEDVS